MMLLFVSCLSFAQMRDPVIFRSELKYISPRDFVLNFTGIADKGWHIYSTGNYAGGPSPATLTLDSIRGAIPEGVLTPGEGESFAYDNLYKIRLRFFEKSALFLQKLKITDSVNFYIKGYLTVSACNNENCLPPTKIHFEFTPKNLAFKEDITENRFSLKLIPVILVLAMFVFFSLLILLKKRGKLFLLSVFLFCTMCRNDGYVIHGKIKNNGKPVESGTIYLFNSDMTHSDTVKIKNGKFVFSGKVNIPDIYFLMTEGSRAYAQIFLENERYRIETSMDKNMDDIRISGGKNQALYTLMSEKEKKIGERYNYTALNAEYMNPDTPENRKKDIITIFNKIQSEVDEYKYSLMDKYPKSYFTLKTLLLNVDLMPLGEITKRLKPFMADPGFANNADLDAIISAIDQLKLLQPGMQAPDFTIPDINGRPLKFSDVYRANKITMLDFWASWCVPCRNVHPELKEIYSKYHKSGFEILAVSFDSIREKWLEAIAADNLPWLHVSDVRHWNSIARDLYHITYVPQYVLVNSEGIILNRKFKEKDLPEMLWHNLN